MGRGPAGKDWDETVGERGTGFQKRRYHVGYGMQDGWVTVGSKNDNTGPSCQLPIFLSRGSYISSFRGFSRQKLVANSRSLCELSLHLPNQSLSLSNGLRQIDRRIIWREKIDARIIGILELKRCDSTFV